jgi:adenosine kinase
MAEPKIFVCGSIAMDRIMLFDGSFEELIHPDKLDILSISVLANSLELARGGVGANIAYGLARLGESPVLVGSIGEDGSSYLQELTGSGIDTKHVHVSTLPTASFQVLTDKKHNQVGGFYPGAMSDAASLHIPDEMAENDIFCLSAHDPAAMRMQANECRQRNIRLCFDPGQQVNNVTGDDLKNGIETAELLIVNAYEYGVLCKKTEMSPEELASKIQLIVVTHGENGSVMTGAAVKDTIIIKPTKATAIEDPTGAGDAYRSGLLYGYLRKWELQKCGQLASVVASVIIEHPGTRFAFTKQQVAYRYKAAYGEVIAL